MEVERPADWRQEWVILPPLILVIRTQNQTKEKRKHINKHVTSKK